METDVKVILPPDHSASMVRGYVDNVVVQLDMQTRYSLAFMDYYRFVEEITRQRDYDGAEFFAKANLILIGKLTEENIISVANQLVDAGFYDELLPDHLISQNLDLDQLLITFPEWYVGDDDIYLTEIKGYLDGVKVQFESTLTYSIDFESFISFLQRAGGMARDDSNFFIAEPALVLVPKVSVDILKKCIESLVKLEDFFHCLKPQPNPDDR